MPTSFTGTAGAPILRTGGLCASGSSKMVLAGDTRLAFAARVSVCPLPVHRWNAIARSLRALALWGALLVVAHWTADAAWAGSKYNQKNSRNGYGFNAYSFEAFRKQQQAEMERRAKEQARAQQQAMRDAGKGKAQQQQNRQKAGKANAGGDGDGDDVDPSATEAERNVRAIAKLRQQELERVQREHAQELRREHARSERIREHMLRKRERDLANTLKAPARPPRMLPAAVTKSEPADPPTDRRPGLLDTLPAQASHLGMSRRALRGDRDKDDETGRADAAETDGAGRLDVDAHAAGDARGVNVIEWRSAKSRTFPGRDTGAEMPSKMFVDERKSELVVSDISPVDLETAKAHGFVLGESIDLKGGGKVRRLSAPGFTRDEAERELHKILPFLPVTPNHAYTIFMGTLGESEGASAMPGLDPRKLAPASAKPCPAQTCFGGQLIHWSKTLGSCTKDVRIGVIDTSFDIGHPSFKSVNAIQGEFLSGERPSPYDWHGTAVLSLLAGNPVSGTPGLVPDATFLLATAFRSDVNGNASTDTVRLLAALDWLEQLDVDIVNMSFSGPQDNALAAAIARMSKKGVVFIAAAGNMGPTAAPSYPAAYPNVIAVTAVNRNGMNYKSANRGSYIDVAAPGVDILTALPDAKQGYRTGTSFAVPFVTAIMATKVHGGEPMTEQELLAQIATRDLGPPGPDPIYGAGLVVAPKRCARGDAVADGAPASGLDAWSTRTTFIKAGAGFAP